MAFLKQLGRQKGLEKQRMRILYLNTTYNGGGAERVVRQIYNGMKEKGHQVYEIVCYNQRGTINDSHVHVLYSSVPEKILHRMQTYNRGNFNLTIPYSVQFICHFIKKHRIDVVHLHNPHDSFLGIRDIRTIQEQCPMVWTLHDFWALTGHCAFPFGCDNRWKTGCGECERLENYPRLRKDRSKELWKKKQNYLAGADIQFTVPSEWMKRQLESSYLKEEKCEVISNSLDTSLWKALNKQELRKKYGLQTNKFILAFVAADIKIPQKGMKTLEEVIRRLDPDKFMLLIAGKCSEELENLVKKFEIKIFGYLSEQEKMNEFYSLADLLVNPSIYETFGLVNIEAMASGTPVAAFDICVMPEIIDENVGWCAEETTPASMKNLIEKIEGDREKWNRKALACHNYVENKYNQQEMLDQFERLYQRVSQ